MTDRDRLIELLKKADSATWGQTYESYADYLLKNGVIVQPCKVGDNAYALFNGKVFEANIFSIKIETEDNKYVFMLKLKIFDHFFQFKTFLLGKTAFLTKEEAEKALKEREQG